MNKTGFIITSVMLSAAVCSTSAFADEVPESETAAPEFEQADELVAQDGVIIDGDLDDAAESVGDVAEDAAASEDAEMDDESEGFSLPFSVSLSLGLSTDARALTHPGSTNISNSPDGPRVDPNNPNPDGVNYSASDAVASSIGLGLSYPLPISQTMALSWSWGYNKYLTRAGGINEQYEGRWSDMNFGFGWNNLYVIPGAEIGISWNVGASAPTSATSQWMDLRTTLSTGVSLRRAFGDFSVAYSFGYRKNIHDATSIVIDEADAERLANVGADLVFRDSDRVGETDIALASGILSSFSISNTVALGYSWLDAFNTSLSLTLSQSYRYNTATVRDGAACETEANSSGTACGAELATSVRHSDVLIGSISQSYSFLDHYAVSLSLQTAGSVFTSYGQNRVRFPFYDTQGGGSYTSVALGLSASY